MKAVIVFHSVCGNDYVVARAFYHKLKTQGVDTRLFRVSDSSWVEKPDLSVKARENIHALRALPEATPDVLLDADLIIMGSPTYFGNVSAQMKAFMDATGGLWFHGKLAGRKFAAFTSAGNPEGGGDLCLQALHTYGRYMGMLPIPVPVAAVMGEQAPALGVIQYSNSKYAEEIDIKTQRVIDGFCNFLVKVLAQGVA